MIADIRKDIRDEMTRKDGQTACVKRPEEQREHVRERKIIHYS